MSLDTTTLSAADRTRVELYHCASMHGTYEQQRSTIERLHSLTDTDLVDDVERCAWAHRLTPAADDEWCENARETYNRFRSWAAKNDRSLEPAFNSRTVSPMVDEDYEVIDFPVLCIAVYADGELVQVAPSTDPVTEATLTVGDLLEEFEASVDAPTAAARSHS